VATYHLLNAVADRQQVASYLSLKYGISPSYACYPPATIDNSGRSEDIQADTNAVAQSFTAPSNTILSKIQLYITVFPSADTTFDVSICDGQVAASSCGGTSAQYSFSYSITAPAGPTDLIFPTPYPISKGSVYTFVVKARTGTVYYGYNSFAYTEGS